ncbi:L-serine dehydratase [Clostridium pascui]|uniref:L-serine ammonia-lyase, iron-sulfur-dependent subunit beta n=1 Tax=Clostridium pascui TaxID=46609 RepID=UPI00195CACAC|nr:L-serine ammonia-lyase, iron-sulfur-dependent subunit beta [Clostridium pascui]MBM7870526.1 L-serine dehydratase [Clostridium pascui]
MKKFGVFDIVGPIMIGPSSSHTAGAARLAKIARIVAGKEIKSVEFYLHGSFAKTYKGHGTDRALVAGILGMDPWDERLRDSIKIAKDKNIGITFHEADLGDVHPNTVKFIIHKDDGTIIEVMGSSVGGGNIEITRVNGEEIEFTGAYPTLIINHIDIPGMISKVTALLYEGNINIAFMKVYRSKRGANATMVFETDSIVEENIVQKIKDIPYIGSVKVISPTEE